MRGVVVGIKNGQAAVWEKGGGMRYVPDTGYQKGQLLELPETADAPAAFPDVSGAGRNVTGRGRAGRFIVRYGAGIAAALAISLAGGGITAAAATQTASTVTLNAYPALEYRMNYFDRVIGVTSEDGSDVPLDETVIREIRGKRIDDAIEISLDALEEKIELPDDLDEEGVTVRSSFRGKRDRLKSCAEDGLRQNRQKDGMDHADDDQTQPDGNVDQSGQPGRGMDGESQQQGSDPTAENNPGWSSDDMGSQNPVERNRDGQNPGGRNTGSQNDDGKNPGNNNDGGKAQGAQNPTGQNSGGQNSGGQNAESQAPGDQNPAGQNSGGQNPGGQSPDSQSPGGQAPGSQNDGGQAPANQDPGRQNPGSQNPGGNNPGSQPPGGGDPAGQTPGIQDPDGQDPGGEPAESRDPGERPSDGAGSGGGFGGSGDADRGGMDGRPIDGQVPPAGGGQGNSTGPADQNF